MGGPLAHGNSNPDYDDSALSAKRPYCRGTSEAKSGLPQPALLLAFRQISSAHFDLTYAANAFCYRDQSQDKIRSVHGDDLWLSPAYDRDSVTFHFTWVRDEVAIRPAMAAVEERLMPLGARPHWGKLTSMPPAEIIASYPRQSDFERLMARYDPAGKFRNTLIDGLFPPR